MPTYEYSCDDCGAAFERRSSASRRLVDLACPGCEGERVRQAYRSPLGYNAAATHTGWSDVAPVDETGNPMSIKEAARAGFTQYSADEVDRERAHRAAIVKQDDDVKVEESIREGWRDKQSANRIRIRSKGA